MRRVVAALGGPLAVVACQALLDFDGNEPRADDVEASLPEAASSPDLGTGDDGGQLDAGGMDVRPPRCDACSPERLRDELNSPSGLAADGVELFIGSEHGRTIVAVRLDALRADGGFFRPVASGIPVEPGHMAVDDSYVYFGTTFSDGGAIYRVAKDGGSAVPYIPCPAACPGVAVRDGVLYYTVRGARDRLFSFTIADAAQVDLELETRLGLSLERLEDVDVSPDAGFFVADDLGHRLLRFDPRNAYGGAVAVERPAGVAADGTHVWVTTEDAGELLRIAQDLSEQSIERMSTGHNQPVGVVVTEDAVYWTVKSSGELWRLRR